jgi:8-oxo-dGTP diphosphatase
MLKRKTGITGVYKEQLYTFWDNVWRDPRGHVIALAYYALVKAEDFLTQVDFTQVDIVTVKQAQGLELFYQHDKILDYALERLKWKLWYTDIVKELLPENFRISQMQKMYELILGRKLDKRNFQKKIFSLKIITETGQLDRSTNRPAKLYKFDNKRIKVIDML